jgi:predicted esterase
MDIVKKEVDYYPDKDLKRIFIGGLSMGGSMALSTYLRYNEKDRLGGIISLYGVNPLAMENMKSTELQKFTRSKTPILLFNNDHIIDEYDVEYTANYIKEAYTKNAALDNYQFIESEMLGNVVSNIVQTPYFEDTKWYPKNKLIQFGLP